MTGLLPRLIGGGAILALLLIAGCAYGSAREAAGRAKERAVYEHLAAVRHAGESQRLALRVTVAETRAATRLAQLDKDQDDGRDSWARVVRIAPVVLDLKLGLPADGLRDLQEYTGRANAAIAGAWGLEARTFGDAPAQPADTAVISWADLGPVYRQHVDRWRDCEIRRRDLVDAWPTSPPP